MQKENIEKEDCQQIDLEVLPMKWVALLDRYSNYLICRDKLEATIKSYKKKVAQMLDWMEKIGKMPESITQEDLDSYKVHLKQHYDQNSLIPTAAAINSFFKMLNVKTDLKMTSSAKIRKNVVPLTIDEIARIFEKAKNDLRDYAILTTLYYGQLRQKELRFLNIDNIDFERAKIRVVKGKGNTYREINLYPIAIEAIRNYLKVRPTPIDEPNALFVSTENKRIGKTAVWDLVKHYAEKAEIAKRVYPHLFRHSCITHMSENGATLSEIQSQSGHKDLDTLMGYIHPSEKHCKEVYLKTVPAFNGGVKEERPQESTNNAQIPALSIEERKLRLVDMLLAGKISEETYRKSLELLEKADNR